MGVSGLEASNAAPFPAPYPSQKVRPVVVTSMFSLKDTELGGSGSRDNLDELVA